MATNPHSGHRDRVKQKFIEFGSGPFREHELVELLLFFGIPRLDTNEIAHRLMDRFGSIHAMLSANIEQLLEVEGIGEHSAVLIRLCGDLVKRCGIEDHPIGTKLSTAEEMGAYLLPRFWGEQEEKVRIVTLNNRKQVIKDTVISFGTLTASAVNMQMILQQALRDKATGVILAHSHPAGHAVPSQADLETTALVISELRKIGVSLIDHIIVADTDYVSLKSTSSVAFAFGR